MENCAAMAWKDGKNVSIEKGPAMDSAASRMASRAWRPFPGSIARDSAPGAAAELSQPLCSVFTALENLHQRRPDHHTINMAAEHVHLLTATDTEPGTNRNRSQLTRPIEIVYDFRRYGDVLPRGSGHGDRIDKTLTAGTQRFQTLRLGHGCHH